MISPSPFTFCSQYDFFSKSYAGGQGGQGIFYILTRKKSTVHIRTKEL